MSAYQPTEAELASSCMFEKSVGDIVQLGDNAGPEFEIVHIEGKTAWIRKPVTFADEALVPLSRLRFVRPAASFFTDEHLALFTEHNAIFETIPFIEIKDPAPCH
jgi:hypothetical protein